MAHNDSGRFDGDSWDLASSVGATATMVAAGRAIASRDADALIDDQFAAPLVRAVGMEFFTKVVDGELDITAIDPAMAPRMQAMIDEMAVRTKFFDDYFLAATTAGARQAVILASGLDSRAYRLPWPAGTMVYEIDQPEVVEFKTTTLAGIGAQPTAVRRTVSIDLRDDWPAALQANGFDAGAATAWAAEGLLIYLPSEAQDRLFDNITALSAPGSTVATEYVPGLADFDAEKARAQADGFRQFGLDIDMPSLVFHGERTHVVEYLNEKGWRTTGVPRTELFATYQRSAPERGDDDPLGEIVYVSATLAP